VIKRIILSMILLLPLLAAHAQQVDIHHPQVKDGATGLFIDGTAYVPIDVVNQIMPGTFAWDADNKAIVKGGPSSGKAILFVGEQDSPTLSALKANDLQVERKLTLPDQLGAYSAVVLAEEDAYSPSVAPRLLRYLQKGGGLVLLDEWPRRFKPGYDTFSYDVGSAAGWFGAGKLQNSGGSNRIGYCIVNNPFGARVPKGSKVWSRAGGDLSSEPRIGDLSDASHPIVIAPFYDNEDPLKPNGFTAVLAFAHPYPPGRVYWQLTVPPDHRQLVDIFVGGVRWAAGITKDISGGALDEPAMPAAGNTRSDTGGSSGGGNRVNLGDLLKSIIH